MEAAPWTPVLLLVTVPRAQSNLHVAGASMVDETCVHPAAASHNLWMTARISTSTFMTHMALVVVRTATSTLMHVTAHQAWGGSPIQPTALRQAAVQAV
jgi:hypothetical protein